MGSDHPFSFPTKGTPTRIQTNASVGDSVLSSSGMLRVLPSEGRLAGAKKKKKRRGMADVDMSFD